MFGRKYIIILVALLFLLVCNTVVAFEIDSEGIVTYVVDGDSLDVYATSGFGAETTYRIRLADINAPEMSTSEGVVAKQVLKNLVEGKHVYIDVDDITTYDLYDRVVAVVYLPVNDTHAMNINYYMVLNATWF